MVGKSFIKRGFVVGLVAFAVIGLMAVTGGAVNTPSSASGRTRTATVATAQGQNGQCDRGGYAASDAGLTIVGYPTVTTLLTIPNYKHPCAGPLLFTSSIQSLWSDAGIGVEVTATCLSGPCGAGNVFGGDPGGGAIFYYTMNAGSGGYGMTPYNGGFSGLPVGLYDIKLLAATGGGSNTVYARSIQVHSYSGPAGGGGGIGG